MIPTSIPIDGNNGERFPKNLTPRDIQLLRASRISQARTREAVAAVEGDTYRILFHDQAAGVMRLRRRQNPSHREGYTVNYKTLTCTCPDMQQTLFIENRRCAEHGLCASLLCKHQLIAWDLAYYGKATEPEAEIEAYADFMESSTPTSSEAESDHRQMLDWDTRRDGDFDLPFGGGKAVA